MAKLIQRYGKNIVAFESTMQDTKAVESRFDYGFINVGKVEFPRTFINKRVRFFVEEV